MDLDRPRPIHTFSETPIPFHDCSELRLSFSLGHVTGFAESETTWNIFASQDTLFEIQSFAPEALCHLAQSKPSLLRHPHAVLHDTQRIQTYTSRPMWCTIWGYKVAYCLF